MTKHEQICTAIAEASRAMAKIPQLIVELTKDKPFELFDKNVITLLVVTGCCVFQEVIIHTQQVSNN